MRQISKVDGVYYFVPDEKSVILDELITVLESKGILKKADIENIKTKAKSKAVLSKRDKLNDA